MQQLLWQTGHRTLRRILRFKNLQPVTIWRNRLRKHTQQFKGFKLVSEKTRVCQTSKTPTRLRPGQCFQRVLKGYQNVHSLFLSPYIHHTVSTPHTSLHCNLTIYLKYFKLLLSSNRKPTGQNKLSLKFLCRDERNR